MCRSIKPLFNFDPPATDEEIRAASLQFVRKLSGMTEPSSANEAAFERAVDEIANAATQTARDRCRPAPLPKTARSKPSVPELDPPQRFARPTA